LSRPLIRLDVVPVSSLSAQARDEIIALCASAYQEDFTRLFENLPDSTHVLARDGGGTLVGHAEWVTRSLQPAGHTPLRTAYVEAVATAPPRQRQGVGTAVLRRLAGEIVADARWQLAALSPSRPDFYARLGWEPWRGPLAIRRDGTLDPTPATEQIMILRLPRTPASLDPAALMTAEWRVGEPW
jgi:aminoglycoside 2'-N-acetyltransferase I